MRQNNRCPNPAHRDQTKGRLNRACLLLSVLTRGQSETSGMLPQNLQCVIPCKTESFSEQHFEGNAAKFVIPLMKRIDFQEFEKSSHISVSGTLPCRTYVHRKENQGLS